MIIVAALLAPVAIYTLLLLMSEGRWGGRVPPVAAAAVACVWVFAGVAATMYYGAKWPSSIEIAWTGMQEPPEAPTGRLVIGGSRQTDVVGWPNGSFEPRLAIEAARGAAKAQLEVTRGGAFIVDPESQQVINGHSLEAGHPLVLDRYQFTLYEAPRFIRWFFSRRIRVTEGTRIVADFTLNRRAGNRFYGLDYLNSRTDPEKVEKYAPYENWSRSVLVAASGNDTIKLLDPAYRSSITCVLPCTFDVRWRRVAQRLVVDHDTTGALSVHFERPWRKTSPIPPKLSDGSWQLVVTRHPEPGDYAFLLPLGGGVSDPRAVLTLDDADGPVHLRSGGANTNGSLLGREPVVTSAAGVRIGPTVQQFVTSIDVLNAAAVTVALFFALVALLAGIALTRPLLARHRQWLVYGLCTVAWALLALRTGLAVRFAASPELLDRLAVSGIRLSLLAAGAIPGAILLSVYLRAEQNQSRPLPERQRRGRWATAYLLFLLAVAWFEITSPQLIFPKLPRVITPVSGGLSSWLGGVAAVLVIAYFFLSIRSVARAKRESPLPFPFYRLVAIRGGNDFWNGITSARTPRDLLPLAVMAFLLLVVLPFLLRVVAFAGTKFVQEVMTPLVFTLVPATLWLSATVHFRQRGPRRTSWWLLAGAAAVITVGLPLIVTPVMISDPGSVLATSSVFVPLAALLLLSDRARPAGIVMAAIFAVALLGMIVLYFNVETILPVGNKSSAGNVPSRLFVYARGGGVPQAILAKSAALEDAYEHTWENRAIAYEGGWQGLGFGNAPNRRSRIGQQTLQADSVFSFFILGDHGVAGGIALLLIYLAPFVFFLWYGRREMQLSTALGLLVSASFFLEAAAHAAMNLGILPFAGRNLPLLASNSPTDAVKWACLLVVAAQTPSWSITGTELSTVTRARPAIFSETMQRWSKWILAGGMIAVLTTIGVEAGRVVGDARFGEPFTWDSILEEVQHLADAGELTVDAATNVTLRNPATVGERSLLVRELHAFNQLSIDEKLGEPPGSQLPGRLFFVRTPAEFNRALREESASQSDVSPGRPPLFRLVALPKFADEAGEIPIVGETHKVVPNSLFNTRISFRKAPTKQLPLVIWSARQWGTFMLRGAGFNIEIPRRPPQPFENRIIDLEASGPNSMQVRSDTNAASPRGEIYLRVPVGRSVRRKLYLRFDVAADGLFLDDPPGGFHLRIGRRGSDVHVVPRDRVKLAEGDTVRLPVSIGVQPQFSVEERGAMPLIGPAWVDGNWRVATDSVSPFPWTPYLEAALEREWERLGPDAAAERYRSLTVNRDLQAAAQASASIAATWLHAARLQRFAAWAGTVRAPSARALQRLDEAMPPRVALSIVRVPSGEVLAMAGAPRMSPGDIGSPCDGGGFCPSYRWIDELAPSFIRVRYGGDRNFDTIEMGSSTKPLFAAAALTVQPELDRNLHVEGPKEMETSVFGIPITAHKGWLARVSPRWTDFRRYLAESDNRYQVRLGFLALAERDANGMLVGGRSDSDRESMDGATEWHRYPRFPARMQFSDKQPAAMQRIDDSPFAQAMRSMYNVGIRQGDFLTRRYSLWTANEMDDLPLDRRPPPVPAATNTATPPAAPLPVSHSFDAISPQVAALGFDYIREPRQYVSLLLGGNENRWANVDFAAAFATAVTGHPVVPHILPSTVPAPARTRRSFPAIAVKLHPGLEAVVTEGTAAFAKDALVPPALRAIPNLKVYAKTGTLAVDEGHATTSRLVIAFIVWENEGSGTVKKGIVLSMVGEHANIGDATRWLSTYISQNAEVLAHELQ